VGDRGRNLLAESNSPELGDDESSRVSLGRKVAKAYFHSLGRMACGGGRRHIHSSIPSSSRVRSSGQLYPAFSFVCSRILRTRHASLGYFYWFRGDEVRSQPIYLKGGYGPELRVWWTGRQQAPWEMGLLYTMQHDRDSAPEFIFMRMIPSGAGWEPVQAGVDVDFGGKGTATFADLDGDGTPEIVSWVRGVPDTLFVPCNDIGCPELLTERIFRSSAAGCTTSTRSHAVRHLVLFVRSLVGGRKPSRRAWSRSRRCSGARPGWLARRAFALATRRHAGPIACAGTARKEDTTRCSGALRAVRAALAHSTS
jgi:hypothetical protein